MSWNWRARSRRCPEIARIDLLTRRIVDNQVSADDARHEGTTVRTTRASCGLNCGPELTSAKRSSGNDLDTFVDNAVQYLKELDRVPDIIHSHYADAGYVGTRLSALLGRPLVYTGHSLGRVKRRRLLAAGLKRAEIETGYTMSRRIDAEENALGAAKLIVVTSTHNEVDEQYALYDYYQPEQCASFRRHRSAELPPARTAVSPVRDRAHKSGVSCSAPDKPMILALSRPDARKNIAGADHQLRRVGELQRTANLVVRRRQPRGYSRHGQRSRRGPERTAAPVDRYDLYGNVAYPKHHSARDVPVIYRLTAAVAWRVFIIPALTEPFGLTLIEAAASGLPVVATEDGGPQDIIGTCHNGILVDPLDCNAITKALLKILLDEPPVAGVFAASGVDGVHAHYSWNAHAKRFLDHTQTALERQEPLHKPPLTRRPMLYHDRAMFTDLDQNLLGDPGSLSEFLNLIRREPPVRQLRHRHRPRSWIPLWRR